MITVFKIGDKVSEILIQNIEQCLNPLILHAPLKIRVNPKTKLDQLLHEQKEF